MQATLLAKLTDCLGADAVGVPDGIVPRRGDAEGGLGTHPATHAVAKRPASSVSLFPPTVEALGETLAVLDGEGETVLPWGGGTAMLPLEPPPSVIVGTERVNRLIDYQPDDMTVTAEAGMTLAALQAILAERGQRLPFDPPLPERATLGGIVATDRTGPWRCAHRSPRDWLIGLTVIGADGRPIRGGGRVVKNVAGYDLPRLYAGSRGTLGVIAEVTFKLIPQPGAAALVAVPLEDAERAEAAVARVMDSHLMPACLELLNGRAWSELTEAPLARDRPFVLVAGFEGVAAAVTWQIHALHDLLAGIGATVAIPEARREALWVELRDFPIRPAYLSASAALPSSDVAEFAAMCERAAGAQQMGVSLAAHAANGIVRLRLHSPARDPIRTAGLVDALRAEAAERGGSLVVTGAAPDLAGRVDFWGPPGPAFRLMRGLKDALDPNGTFYAGGFLGGI
jgi:glycolate oxidase FAD binding subunit